MTNAERQAAWRERVKAKLAERATDDRVSESDQAKIDRLVAKAIKAQVAELQAKFLTEVRVEAKKAAPGLREEMERERDKYIRENAHMARIKSGLKPLISEADYRFLLGALHPDRQPSPEKQAKAFDIVRKLDPYLAAFKKSN